MAVSFPGRGRKIACEAGKERAPCSPHMRLLDRSILSTMSGFVAQAARLAPDA
jgi:hypothetical protein